MAGPTKADVARMQQVIDMLRSVGVEVREMPGWQTRGFAYPAPPTRIFDHHDASSRKSGEWGSLGLVLDGTPRGIPGPLSNFEVARCLDGVPKVAIVAAGYTYHGGEGGPWNELSKDNANPHTYGTEKANDGLTEPYTEAANYATNALFWATAKVGGRDPGTFPLGHKEWTTRKTDPVYSMADRRRQVAGFIPKNEEDDMQLSDPIESRIPADVNEKTNVGKTVTVKDILQNIQVSAYAAAQDAAAALKLAEETAAKQVGYGTRVEQTQKQLNEVAAAVEELKPAS